MIHLRYFLGALFSLPFLPLLYLQAKRVKASVPILPEAEGPEGYATMNSPDSPPFRLITIGESTIAGVGVQTHEEGFSGTLATELAQQLQQSVAWKVYARSGYTAAQVVKHLLSNISEEHIDLIVIGLGANDAFALHPPARWQKDVSSLIVRLRKAYPRVPIAFANMPPIKEFPAFPSLMRLFIGSLVELLGQALAQVVKDYEQVYYFGEVITLEGWMQKFPSDAKRGDFFSDGVHPSKLTYQTWAREVALQIQALEILTAQGLG
ncbi:MAG: SGNH/GDSL hydrolase family protein [Bacteroidota bacterium]